MHGVQGQMLNGVGNGIAAGKSSSLGNAPPVVNLGFKLLQSMGVVPMRNDKLPGYTSIAATDLWAVVISLVQNVATRPNMARYQKLPVGKAAIEWTKAQALAEKLGKYLDDKGLAKWLLKPLDQPRAGIVADLQLLCKNHKDPVTFRVISAVPNYPIHWICALACSCMPEIVEGGWSYTSCSEWSGFCTTCWWHDSRAECEVSKD